MGILFETVAEEHLVQPTFIYDYPIELSPLSKVKRQTIRVSLNGSSCTSVEWRSRTVIRS